MTGIIVGIDGSDDSQRALDWAVHEAGVHQLPLTVLSVYRTTVGSWGGPATYPQNIELSSDARKDADDAAGKALANAAGVRPESVTVRAACGIPAEELVAASRGADMVVVGARGNGGFARMLVGSVSSHVVHHAHCPVVVIPAGDRC